MSRINGYGVTGNELQAMVNERILLAKGSIPATNRCLTNAEVFNGAYVQLGNPPGAIPLINLGGGTFGPSPNFLVDFTNINPIGSQSVLFELDQNGSPYLNADLFASVNGSPLRLDPGSNLDGLFFGGPQYSPQMNQYVKVGNDVTLQGNFGRDDEEVPGNWGWNGGGYGVLEIYQNGVLVNKQTTGWRPATFGPNLSSLTYTFTVQPSVDYYVKAYVVAELTDIFNDCNGQSTVYIGPYPDTFTTDFYVGPGPAMFQLVGLAARKFYSPNSGPAFGSLSNSWWNGHFTIGRGDTVIAASGGAYSLGPYQDLSPTSPTVSPTYAISNWTFIPAGEDSIKLNLYAGSPDTIWEISSYIGCSIPGTPTNLHWSPDTPANACDSNYVYDYFDGVETTITGFSGYRQYLVTGGFQVGGKISIYPSGTGTISNSAYEVNGKRAYVYPDYGSSGYGNSSPYPYPIFGPFVSAGYYSDGTNWAEVAAGTTYNEGIIIEVGTCQGPPLYLEVSQTYLPENKCSNNNEITYVQAYGTTVTVGMQLYDSSWNLLAAFANPGEYFYLKDTANSNVYYVNNNGIVEYIELCPAYDPAGTFISNYCGGYNGTDLYRRYANGSGGYYDQLWETNSTYCGGTGGGGRIEEEFQP